MLDFHPTVGSALLAVVLVVLIVVMIPTAASLVSAARDLAGMIQ